MKGCSSYSLKILETQPSSPNLSQSNYEELFVKLERVFVVWMWEFGDRIIGQRRCEVNDHFRTFLNIDNIGVRILQCNTQLEITLSHRRHKKKCSVCSSYSCHNPRILEPRCTHHHVSLSYVSSTKLVGINFKVESKVLGGHLPLRSY